MKRCSFLDVSREFRNTVISSLRAVSEEGLVWRMDTANLRFFRSSLMMLSSFMIMVVATSD